MADQIDYTDPELEKLIDWFDVSREALQESRMRAMRDRDFYDGNQWDPDDAKDLDDRGQAATVTNHIAPKVNYILGEQISARVDPAALPVKPQHEDGADALTCAMRYVHDYSDTDIYESESFEEFLIEGCGAILVSQERVGNEVEIPLIPVPWDRFAWDHRSRRRDFRDARWLATVAWMDLDDAIAEYPEKEEVLKAAVMNGQPDDDDPFEDFPSWWAEKDANRVRVCQMFYRSDGEWMEAHFTKHQDGWLKKPKKVVLVDDKGKTQCPLIAASAYVARRRSDKPPERYGIVRGMISAQQEINKRRSKALHYMNVAQIHAEQGALLMSKDQAKYELGKPDGYIEYAPGALANNKAIIKDNLELAATQMQLLQEAKSEIDNIGPQAPLLGTDDRVQTGRSLQVRGEAGEKQLKPVFDSMRFWERRLYRAIAWQIKRFWPGEQWVRVTDDKERRGYRFVALNRSVTRSTRLRELLAEKVPLRQALMCLNIQPVVVEEMLEQATQIANNQMQEAQAVMQQRTGKQIPQEAMMPIMEQAVIKVILNAPMMQEEFDQNHIGDIPVDIKIDISRDSVIMQHEEFEKMAELAGTGMVKFPAQALVQASTLRNKKEIMATLNPPPDPMAQQMAQLNLAQMQAEVEKTRAEAAEKNAKAEEAKANVEFKLGPQATKTMGQGMEAAAKAGSLTVPPEDGEEQ